MLNAAWPKLCPFAVIYNYSDQGIYVVNQMGRPFGAGRTSITAFDSHSRKILGQTVTSPGIRA